MSEDDISASEIEELRRKAAWFDAVIDNAPINIYFKNTDGTFQWVNRKFAETFGKPAEDFVGRTATDHLSDDKSKFANDHDRRVLETGQTQIQEEDLLGRTFEVFKCPITGPDGDVIAILGFDIDITERKIAEDIVARHRDELANLNNQKDKFFSILAHDLRSPFNALSGYSHLLSGGIGELDWETVTRYGKALNQSSEQVIRLLDNLLDWSQLQMGGMEFDPGPVELAAICSTNLEMFKPIAERKAIRLNAKSHDPVTALADARMVDTVVRNLVNNAIKSTPDAGEISLTVRRVEGWAEFAVVDTGIGISARDLDRIFQFDEKISTTGTGGETGTGLGLPLCRELVEKQGGRINVESREGEGSTFRVQLPLLDA